MGIYIKVKKRWLLSVSVMLLCFYLSLNLFQLIGSVDAKKQLIPAFNSIDLAEIERLNSKAETLDEQYSFMVFSKERSTIRKQQVNVLHQKINLQPFDSELWRELTFLQSNDFSEHSSAVNDRKWTFLVAKQLLQWNPNERVVLLKRCYYFSLDQQVDIKKECKSLADQVLKVETLKSLERKLDLTSSSLLSMLMYFGVSSKKGS